MIYAVKHNKVNRAIYKANEDALTSSIFERLMYLPQELLHHIFSTALFANIEGLELHQIESIEYWPKWVSEPPYNTNYVEPDVFIRTANQDIIIEAKRNKTNRQDPGQWESQIRAYYNEYGEDDKEVVYIALDGLRSKNMAYVNLPGKEHKIYKCNWESILNAIQNIIFEMELTNCFSYNEQSIKNILNDIVLCFELFDFSTSPWLEHFMKAPNIQNQSIHFFSASWTN